MRFTLGVLLAAAALVPRAAAAQDPGGWASLDTVFAKALREAGAPGGAMALVRGDSVVHVVALGVRSVEAADAVTADTRFRVASATKMVTGLLAADLAGAGRLELSAPLSRYTSLPAPALRAATPEQLLSHTAGLRDAAAVPGSPRRTLREAAIGMGADPLARPGEIYSYANAGFTLAGYLIETRAGRPFREVAEARVLRPLGMASSTFSPLAAMTHSLALGHSGGAEPGVVRPFTDDPSLDPRGGLISTAPDMARLLIVLLNDGRLHGRQVIPAASVRTMLRPRATMPDDTANHYGLGVRVVRPRGRPEIGHYGGGLGYGSVVRGDMRARVGVVILVNRDNTILDAVADSALERLGAPRLVPASAETPRRSIHGAEARLLAGRYRNGAQGLTFELAAVDDTLVLMDDDARLKVVRAGERTLAAVDDDGSVAIRWTVVPAAGRPRFLFAFGRAFRRE